MRIAIVGLGSMGKRRLRLIQNNYPQYMICGIDQQLDRRVEVENEFDIETFDSLEKAAESFRMNTVFVCTSPYSHGKLIEEALQLDCDVFTEINLLNDYYAKVIALAEEKNKTLYLSSTFLKRKEIRFIKEKVHADSNINYRYHVGQYLPDWHPWENYQDFFVGRKDTNGCREIFAIELPWIIKTFGNIVSFTVEKKKISSLKIDYPDCYNLILEHDSGVFGTLTVDIVSREARRELNIIGEKLQIDWSGTPDSLFIWENESKMMKQIKLYEDIEKDKRYSKTIIENAYLAEITEFFTVLKGEQAEEYSFEEDDKIVDLIDQIEGINK